MDAAPTPDAALRETLARLRAAHRRQPPGYRQRMDDLERLGEALRRHKDDLVEAVSADFGRRSRHETLAADVMVTLDEISHLRRNLRRWMRPERRGVTLDVYVCNFTADNEAKARQLIDQSGLPIRLEIDGGVKTDNIADIAAAGADMFVAGSAIFSQPDYAAVIAQMRAELATTR